MPKQDRTLPPEGLWAYAYQIVPPQGEDRLGAIRTILDEVNAHATHGARRWTGRVILEEQATHILVVSDRPDQDDVINHRLAAELTALNVGFRLTAPMAATDDGES